MKGKISQFPTSQTQTCHHTVGQSVSPRLPEAGPRLPMTTIAPTISTKCNPNLLLNTIVPRDAFDDSKSDLVTLYFNMKRHYPFWLSLSTPQGHGEIQGNASASREEEPEGFQDFWLLTSISLQLRKPRRGVRLPYCNKAIFWWCKAIYDQSFAAGDVDLKLVTPVWCSSGR